MLVPAGLTGAGSRGRAAVPHGPQAELKCVGYQPDGRGLRGHGVSAAGPRSRNPEKRQHKDHRAATRRRDADGQSPQPESGSREPGEGIRRPAKRPQRRGADGDWGESRDNADDSNRTYAALLLDMHDVPAGEEIPCLVLEEARRKAAVAVLPGSGQKVSAGLGGCFASSGRDIWRGEWGAARYGGNGERKRGTVKALSRFRRINEMQALLYMALFAAFTRFVVTVQNHRRLLAVTLAGVMV